jgi:2,4-dienoyl-CoA reductase-like NADH-dependent reductase (Old Yellow Enzyme family)
MCQFACLGLDGMPGSWHLVNAGTYAAGGAGLVMVESTGVSPDGRITDRCPGIWNESQEAAWVPVVDFIHSQGAVAGIQLNHAGRKGSGYANGQSMTIEDGGWPTMGPSEITVDGMTMPRAMDQADIDEVIHDFGTAAFRSVEAGFDVIELHAAHGYLIHQFLSPLSNERTDQYGGTLENRARLLLEIIREIRGIIPESVVLFVRFSASDWADGGLTPEETAVVAEWAEALGADLFDISSGGLLRNVFISSTPGYQVEFSHTVRQRGVRTAAVGKITTALHAQEILEAGKADAIFLGRQLINDPHFPLRAAHELGVEVDYIPRPHQMGHWS